MARIDDACEGYSPASQTDVIHAQRLKCYQHAQRPKIIGTEEHRHPAPTITPMVVHTDYATFAAYQLPIGTDAAAGDKIIARRFASVSFGNCPVG